jgi:hypothetical protein
MDKNLKRATIAMVCALILATAVYASVKLWQAQVTITQTVQEAATVSAKTTITLPTAYQGVYGNYTVPYALNVTTRTANLKLWINQTETQRSSISSNYAVFVLHLRTANTTTDVLVLDMTKDTYAYVVLTSAGTYQYDYFIEYCPTTAGNYTWNITVSVTTT